MNLINDSGVSRTTIENLGALLTRSEGFKLILKQKFNTKYFEEN